MKTRWINLVRVAAVVMIATLWVVPGLAQDQLPSWNDTAPKKAILTFVERVTKEGSSDFVPPAERIATFDNDGTLWSEQPIYFQVQFAIDRVKALSPKYWHGRRSSPSRPCSKATARRWRRSAIKACCRSWRRHTPE